MAKSALLDLVADSRRKIIYHEEDGKNWIETRQDVAPIIQAAKDLWDDNPPLDMRQVAVIPETVINQAFSEGWFHDESAWKRWANDPANACFRTCKGTI